MEHKGESNIRDIGPQRANWLLTGARTGGLDRVADGSGSTDIEFYHRTRVGFSIFRLCSQGQPSRSRL